MCNHLQNKLSAPFLFSKSPTIKIEPDERICNCGSKLKVQKTLMRKKVVTLQIGKFEVHETVKYCPCCNQVFRYNGLDGLIPEFGNFGFDVIEYVGRSLFLEHHTIDQVVALLREKNIHISDREVNFLGKKFIYYLVQVHKNKSSEIKQFLHVKGGYVLHFDATCDGDSPHLFCGIAAELDLVLGSVKMPSETTESIISFLMNIKEQYGEPLAGVSDMLRSNLTAFKKVFPGIPHFICHFHFLRDLGKDLMGCDYSMLRDEMKRYEANKRLRELYKRLKEIINIEDEKLLDKCNNNDLSALSNLPNHIIAYLLVVWIRDFKSELNGYGFPFDQAQLVLFKRMEEVYQFIIAIPNESTELIELKYFLGSILMDPEVQNCVARLQQKVIHFNQLRQAMRIALPNGKKGLNDDGEIGSMKTIKEEVSKFIEQDEIKNSNDISYQKMCTQIKKYWDKLFADPITVTLKNGESVLIYLQRTNNLIERFFRELNRGNRKRNGGKSMKRVLQTMLAETPMIKNLNNPEYVKIICGELPSLAACFAKIESEQIRNNMKRARDEEEKLSASVKKLIRIEKLPRQIFNLIKKKQIAVAV